MQFLKKLPDIPLFFSAISLLVQQIRFKKKLQLEQLPRPGAKINPPGTGSKVFKGFISSTNNDIGLKLSIFNNRDGGVCCEWLSTDNYEGYPQTLHGGISFAILDELLAHAVFDEYSTFAVTISSQTRWKSRIKIGSTIYGKAFVAKKFWRLAKVYGVILNHKGRPLVTMHGIFYFPTKNQFKKIIDLSVMPKEAIPYCGID